MSHHALTETDFNSTLRQKRKARELKACRPCRQRKVKCDQDVPCCMCRERGHPDLCEYEMTPARPFKTRRVETRPTEHEGGERAMPGSVQVGAGCAPRDIEHINVSLEAISHGLTDLKKSLQERDRSFGAVSSNTGTLTKASCTSCDPINAESLVCATRIPRDTAWAYQNSLCNQLVRLGQKHGTSHAVRNLFEKDALPFFGLDNAFATYPFVDLWGLPQGPGDRTSKLSRTFPSDTDCWLSFKAYKDTAHVLFPVFEDLEALEDELVQFLVTRRENQDDESGEHLTEASIFGRDISWVGLMFAILASGSQCSSLECRQRELTSKVYTCCSFECLRMVNFLAGPDARTVQTLLILGNVLCNNVNVGVAWSLLGLTTRLCHTQESLQTFTASDNQPSAEASSLTRQLWRRIMWQDSFLFVTDGRATSVVNGGFVVSKAAMPTGPCTYADCLSQLSKVAADLLCERSRENTSYELSARTEQVQLELDDIFANAAGHLQDRRLACSRQHKIENAALYLLASHVRSELLRPALDPALDQCTLARRMRASYIDASVNTIDAFLHLQDITPFARRSWLAVYRAVSCAVLLATMRVAEYDPRALKLIGRLVSTLNDTQDPTEMSSSIAVLLRTIKTLLRPTGRDSAGSLHISGRGRIDRFADSCRSALMSYDMK